jgi:hypothetical protein
MRHGINEKQFFRCRRHAGEYSKGGDQAPAYPHIRLDDTQRLCHFSKNVRRAQ